MSTPPRRPGQRQRSSSRVVVFLIIIGIGWYLQRSEEAEQENAPPSIPVVEAPSLDPDEEPIQQSATDENTARTPEIKISVPNTEPDEQAPFLVEVSENIFESPAGLVYRSGSVDGHRVDHVLSHAEDIPSKPIHGVFRGDREEIFKLIDDAWKIAQTRGPPQVETEQNRDRTVLTVDMKRPIGYVGGQSGKRQGHPECRKIRLVVEDQNVITAYPMR
ncbi:hypothetical protein KOR42_13070 [Thalassoglobus neptunius]|uniref:Uncharacterized protein n=1 Tax=Thalassoglobus neptunius TaxID=1938619 RepID=A0A5C5X5N0_9PLAN|nr:hypothetical protein [Thalassoglobus neptunius]TWT57939.1 hypothetical protein KOR42_13070 [Thalassoglobus neptunius]